MLETDYLVIGSGAVGMAFVDTLLTETDAHVIMVDRHAKPGGHWNDAYPFVTLHQPSHFYGVSSKELSRGKKDETGLNKGLFDLASGAEVSAYFDEVMRQTFLPSGRVQYFPKCNYIGNEEFESLLTGKKHQVSVRKKIVDTTILRTGVPSTHSPNFEIEEGVSFMPINDLVNIEQAPAGYVVIGGGKTGIDACLWLLEQQVEPDDICWIVSRDAWLLDRANTQPDVEFFEQTIGSMAKQMEAIAKAESIPDLFDRLEAGGVFVRIDPKVQPTMFHGATVSPLELELLRGIKNVVRMGRVQRIETDKIILDKGSISTSPKHIHVDCSASAVTNLETKPVFQDKLITPQTIRSFQPIFSAALIAYVEANYEGDKVKNNLCQVVPLPNHDTDWIPMMAAQLVNQATWSQDKTLRTWIRNNRLDGYSQLIRSVDREDAQKMAIIKKMRENGIPAMMKLQQFIQELKGADKAQMNQAQFQVKKDLFFQHRMVDIPSENLEVEQGEILVQIEKFAYSANNITYAVAGDRIGYWHFFPAVGQDAEGWGVIPVWGFAQVKESTVAEIPVGDRLFGYFPPAKYLKMTPGRISDQQFIDVATHRSKLPMGYNLYRRVLNEADYDPSLDRERMLLMPMHMTGYVLWDALKSNDWYGAKRILITSASSKTSTGLAYAIQADQDAPEMIGMTSPGNLEMVKSLDLYHDTCTYDSVQDLDASIPTVIVDMAGNAQVLVALHTHLGDNMCFTQNVGLTHWTNARPQKGIIAERSQFFFAPGQIQQILKRWGPEQFQQKSSAFMKEAAIKTRKWLDFRQIDGIEGMSKIHPAMCEGKISPNEGLIVVL